ncbi:MAG: chemotaxis response regulator protein-glutamate methylesterase [Proteobacteria bacterium]|nr:MAG: chemotaxis response regulator protein-glutamate methylesterase [Pseudomonadota bacterium]
MSKLTRVLIVDDDVVFRTFLRGCMSEMAHVEVLDIARDGREALEKIKALKPDLVTLDMEMPFLTGIEVLQCLQEEAPEVRVLVISNESETSAERTVQALESGAYDFILKSSCMERSPREVLQKALKEKIPLARSIGTVTKGRAVKNKTISMTQKKSGHRCVSTDIIAIGSSTGGPVALHNVLSMLPASFPVPIVVTQHMPKLFLISLVERLEKDTALTCKLAEDGMVLQAGCVYVAPGDIHMEIERVGTQLRAHLVDGERVNHCKPAVDITFHSLVELAPRIRTLAVVLTGMGNDGAAGAKALADRKSHVIVQDKASSVVWGMPGETVKLGAASEVVALNDIAASIMKRCGVLGL